MDFYEISGRQDFAGYWPERSEGGIHDERIPSPYRTRESVIAEYLGEPPRKPAKHGNFHKSAYGYFVREEALDILRQAARRNLLTVPTRIIGREEESFHQVWVTNFVDCLDIALTTTSSPSNARTGQLGVITRPAFDMSRWDGSDLFVVPQDANFCLYCSERFVADWKAARKKGMVFRRFLFDPDPIRA